MEEFGRGAFAFGRGEGADTEVGRVESASLGKERLDIAEEYISMEGHSALRTAVQSIEMCSMVKMDVRLHFKERVFGCHVGRYFRGMRTMRQRAL